MLMNSSDSVCCECVVCCYLCVSVMLSIWWLLRLVRLLVCVSVCSLVFV